MSAVGHFSEFVLGKSNFNLYPLSTRNSTNGWRRQFKNQLANKPYHPVNWLTGLIVRSAIITDLHHIFKRIQSLGEFGEMHKKVSLEKCSIQIYALF